MAAIFGNHPLPLFRGGAPKFGIIGDKRLRKPQVKKHMFQLSGIPFEVDVKYIPVRVLGNGSYGFVCSCRNSETGESVAVKKIGDALCNKSTGLRTLREIQILRQISHENVISLKDVMVSSSTAGKADFQQVYLVQELMEADLGRVINSLSAHHCKFFLFQILKGVHYLHSADVIHRDLKPQNLLLNSNNDIKICDFGLARTKRFYDQPMTEYMTTRWYRAPEILLQSDRYGKEVDMWSVGCIFAEMLGGGVPLLKGSNSLDQIRRIHGLVGTQSASELSFIDCERPRNYLMRLPFSPGMNLWSMLPNANPLGIDLLKKMLVLNPEKRISALEALRHPYFSEIYDPTCENSEVKRVKLLVDELPYAVEEKLIRELMWEEMLLFHPEQRVF